MDLTKDSDLDHIILPETESTRASSPVTTVAVTRGTQRLLRSAGWKNMTEVSLGSVHMLDIAPFLTTDLPATGDRRGSCRVESFTADVVSQEMARMGLDNQILRHFMRLSYVRQPAAHISG